MAFQAKKLINDPNDAVTEFIEGLVETYPGLQYLDGFPEVKVVLRADVSCTTYDKVAVISGGGSGHEPAHAGFVGEGMLTAAICGDVFASPPVDSILAGIRAVTGPMGCLLIVKNYTGDRLNFGLAAEQAKSEGYKVEMVIVGDDCALPPPRGIAGRRGLAGTILVHKMSSGGDKVNTRTDPAWKYHHLLDPANTNRMKCNFCNKVTNGGVSRAKKHLVGGYRDVTACPKCPADVKEEIRAYMGNKKSLKEQMQMMPDIDDYGFDDDDDDVVEIATARGRGKSAATGSSQGSVSKPWPKKPKRKGPIDVYFTPDADVVVQNRKGKQPTIDANDPYKKELRDRAVTKFARWMYDAGIAFNAVKYKSFGPAVEAIGQYGPGMKPPSYHETRVTYLNKEVVNTKNLMKDHKEDWAKYGCSIMSDGWSDRNQKTLINFLVNCPKGTMFIESIDASSFVKDGQKLFELLDKYVDLVGEANVVQVVTDSASANVLAGKFLEAKRPNLYWTPCAAHCIDLILEDIFKIPQFKQVFERAVRMNGYIYARPGVLNMMRRYTREKEMVRHAKTRFATAFLTLSRIHLQKNNLRKMFLSEEWTKSKWAKEQAGKQVQRYLMMPSFWNNVVYALKIAGPLVKVLRLVDSERKPPMGYIYEAMDRAKEAIAQSFGEKVEKYEEFFRIIDNRWSIQLHRPLHAAGHFLNPEFFYSNPQVEQDVEVMTGIYNCITKLVADEETQNQITSQMTTYMKAEGLFSMPLAIRQRTTRAPDGRKAHEISKRLTRAADYYYKFTEQGKASPKDRLSMEILEQAERGYPLLGEASASLANAGDDIQNMLLYLEIRDFARKVAAQSFDCPSGTVPAAMDCPSRTVAAAMYKRQRLFL